MINHGFKCQWSLIRIVSSFMNRVIIKIREFNHVFEWKFWLEQNMIFIHNKFITDPIYSIVENTDFSATKICINNQALSHIICSNNINANSLPTYTQHPDQINIWFKNSQKKPISHKIYDTSNDFTLNRPSHIKSNVKRSRFTSALNPSETRFRYTHK